MVDQVTVKLKLYHEEKHPNGFKIFLAANLCDVQIEICQSVTALKNGAKLHSPHHSPCTKEELSPNSAVLKIFSTRVSLIDLQWLDWEISLQENLIPFLASLTTDSSSGDMFGALNSQLAFLNSKTRSPPQFFRGEVGPIDVVLFGALLPLFSSAKSRKILESHKQLLDYLNFLRADQRFKAAELSYFGEGGVTLQPWSTKQSPIPSSKVSTWSLLKSQDAAGTATKSCSTAGSSAGTPGAEERLVTDREIQEARTYWNDGPLTHPPGKGGRRTPATPILPVKGEKNIMITSALPYVNNVPHLGNIIGCVLSADCFARFCRIRGYNVVYICGTDEYGTATETKALAEGSTPQQICDKYHKIHSNVYSWFNISFDFFGRTTTPSQTKAAQAIFWSLHKNGKISENSVEQLYCENCKRFLADRFVEGTCPHPGCGYEDARGDQCDSCGKLVNATELKKPRCKLCSNTPITKSSSHLFVDLPKIQPELNEWLKKVSGGWTPNAKVICESWLRDGLRERCITRDLKWGTPVPLEGYRDKVFYVWYDAPIGYVSMTMEYTPDWELWWRDPENVSYYQFMAKDNVPFHGVIFPSCQIATEEKWTKVTHLIATEYLNYEDGKFSKSRGVGVFGDQAKETGIASDVWRFYLLYVRPEAHDTAFSWTDLQTKNNSELLNNLGNFINRSLKFVYQFYSGVVPEAKIEDADGRVLALVNQELEKFTKAVGNCRLRDGIRHILSISRIGNQYIQENEPYKLIKADRSDEDKRRGATVINVAVNVVTLIGLMLEPYMPDTSQIILDVLNKPSTVSHLPKSITQLLKSGHRINAPSPLIRKISDDEVTALRKKFAGAPPSPNSKPELKKVENKQVQQGTAPQDPSEIQKLENLVSEQGNKVRALKSQGTAKDALTVEIDLLLALKKQLSFAQGLDPTAVGKSDKKSKKKK